MALLDFDVHHGNGTQACVGNTVPSLATYAFQTPLSSGSQVFPHFKPWLDFDDADHILFARHALQAYNGHSHFAQANGLCMACSHVVPAAMLMCVRSHAQQHQMRVLLFCGSGR